jgi:alpha-L-fucosidase
MQFGGLKGKDQWQSEELINHVRSMQPEIIINNRLEIEQDIVTPEQWQPTDWITDKETGEKVVWETCQTFSGSWGYHRDEHTWKSPKMLIDMLVNTVSCGGNLIMNVGPTSRGYFDKRAEDALKVYENWMKYNSRSIYGCTMAEPEFTAPRGTRLTQSNDGKRLYIHLVEYPYANLVVENIADKIEYAQFLHDGSEVIYEGDTDLHTYLSVEMNGENSVKFKLPPYQLDMTDPVIEVFLK